MKNLHVLCVIGCLFTMSGSVFAEFKSLKSADSFVDKGSWELYTKSGDSVAVDFLPNHTLPEDKAITLGNKKYRFWSVAKHPTMKNKYVLRVHSKKTAGWYSFTWSADENAWVSKHWPKVRIQKK